LALAAGVSGGGGGGRWEKRLGRVAAQGAWGGEVGLGGASSRRAGAGAGGPTLPCLSGSACFCRSLLSTSVASKPALSHSCRGMTSSALANALMKSCDLPGMDLWRGGGEGQGGDVRLQLAAGSHRSACSSSPPAAMRALSSTARMLWLPAAPSCALLAGSEGAAGSHNMRAVLLRARIAAGGELLQAGKPAGPPCPLAEPSQNTTTTSLPTPTSAPAPAPLPPSPPPPLPLTLHSPAAPCSAPCQWRRRPAPPTRA
jgi:hypothetical protein